MPDEFLGEPSFRGGYLYAREFALTYKFVNAFRAEGQDFRRAGDPPKYFQLSGADFLSLLQLSGHRSPSSALYPPAGLLNIPLTVFK